MSNTSDLTAAPVMDAAAALMNDAAKSIYPYTIQIPYLNMALRDLQEIFELNEIPVVATGSAVIPVSAGTDHVGFSDTHVVPYLPDDLIEPSVLWERQSGIDPYTIINKVDFLDLGLAGSQISQFIWYVWETQQIKFFAANQDNDIKMNYIRNLFSTVTASTDSIGVINAQSFLQYRTAALLAEFCAENPTRAQALNADAQYAIDRALGIGIKGRQLIMTRRRPFRSSYKRGTYM